MSTRRKWLLMWAVGAMAAVLAAGGVAGWQAWHRAVPTPAEPVVASSRTAVYHRPTCEWAAKIAAGNLIRYESAQAARADGRRPCQVCGPK
jgi:hypothetical protein